MNARSSCALKEKKNILWFDMHINGIHWEIPHLKKNKTKGGTWTKEKVNVTWDNDMDCVNYRLDILITERSPLLLKWCPPVIKNSALHFPFHSCLRASGLLSLLWTGCPHCLYGIWQRPDLKPRLYIFCHILDNLPWRLLYEVLWKMKSNDLHRCLPLYCILVSIVQTPNPR